MKCPSKIESVYVDTVHGDDANDGTKRKPFRSVERGLAHFRGQCDEANVVLRGLTGFEIQNTSFDPLRLADWIEEHADEPGFALSPQDCVVTVAALRLAEADRAWSGKAWREIAHPLVRQSRRVALKTSRLTYRRALEERSPR